MDILPNTDITQLYIGIFAFLIEFDFAGQMAWAEMCI